MKRTLHILAAGLVASPAFAADSGMPQLDPTWFPSQIFWLAVSFGVLYLIVSLFITPRVGGVLKAREGAINEAIALAEKYKKDAANARGNFEQIMADARNEAAQILAEAQAEVAKDAASANQKLSDELEQKMVTSEAEIKKAVTRATAGIEAAATPLAKEMAEKLLGGKVDEAAVRSAVTSVRAA